MVVCEEQTFNERITESKKIKRQADKNEVIPKVEWSHLLFKNIGKSKVCERFVKYTFDDMIFREFVRETCYNHSTVEFGKEFDKRIIR